jgi:flagellar motor switch protein FliN
MSASISPDLLLEVDLRLSAELGRARMPVSAAVGLSGGAIVELDRSHDEPIDLYVNGRHFGTGRLLIVDGEWSVRIESVDGVAPEPEPEVVHLSVAGDAPADEADLQITPVDSSTPDQG